MAQTLVVLMRAENYINKETGERTPLKQIHESLTNPFSSLYDSYPGIFDYFNEEFDDDEAFYGADEPERMKSFIASIHEGTDNQLDKVFEELILKASENIARISDISDRHLLWKVGTLLKIKSGTYEYGHDFLYKDEDDAYLSEECFKEVQEHPERFVVVTCYYH